jgi:hypothetical protein
MSAYYIAPFLFNHDLQATFIELRNRGASTHHTCLFTLYALIYLICCCQQNLTEHVDDRRKVAATPRRDNGQTY